MRNTLPPLASNDLLGCAELMSDVYEHHQPRFPVTRQTRGFFGKL
jgi:hypothetical protein